MTIMQRKQRTQERVEIPENFVLFLTRVHREIVSDDEAATLESDDLLQYEEYDFAYGGLIDSEAGDYGFRYFTDDRNASIWDINLNKTEIEKIVRGEVRELTVWSCPTPNCGCKFSKEDDYCPKGCD